MSVGTGHQEDSFIHGLRHISRPEQDLGSALTESDSDVDRDSVKPKPDLDIASFPGAEGAERERLVHTVCACA